MAAVFAVSVPICLAIQAREAKLQADTRMGVVFDGSSGAALVTSVVPQLPADRAGIRRGDLLVELMGRATPDLDSFLAVAVGLRRGVTVPLVVEREGLRVRVDLTPGAPFPWLQLAVTTASVLAHLALALFALAKCCDDLRARLLFLLAAAVALELALPTSLGGQPATSLLAAVVLLNGCQMGVELHLASVIPKRQEWIARVPWVVVLYYVIGVGGALWVVSSLWLEHRGVELAWTSGRSLSLYQDLVYPVWALGVPALLGYQALHYAEPRGRHQAGLVMLGGLPWTALVFLQPLAGWAGIGLPSWVDTLWPTLLLAYPTAVFVAIFRYDLIDLEAVVRRSLVYTALTTALVVIFYTALGAGGALFSRQLGGRASVWVVAGATLVLGLVFAPLRRAVQGVIDKRFFPERHALRQRLIALAGELPELGKLPAMGRHLARRLCEVFEARSATLLIADPETGVLLALASTLVDFRRDFDHSFLLSPEDPGMRMVRQAARPVSARQAAARSDSLGQRLAAFDAALVVPLMSQKELIGVLIMGGKQDGTPYPAEEEELLSLVSHHVATVFENARLFESATYESLTGVLRREAILDVLERELTRALRYRRPLTAGMADLDHFKAVNDRFGHLVGDALLQRVAQAMAAQLRSADAMGRYGGEEFLLVLPETDLDSGREVAERIRKVVEQLRVEADEGGPAMATMSIGLAALDESAEGSEVTVEAFLRRADRALYAAKQAGRNRVEPSRYGMGQERGA